MRISEVSEEITNEEENAEARRIFAHSFVEEYEGENVELTHVVIFNEDGTGSMSIQDDIPFTYDDAKITNEDGSLVYDYVIDGDKLTINFVDFTEEFVLSDESVLD